MGVIYGITRAPKAAMAFPIFILLLVPLRFLILPHFFSEPYLKLLDGEAEELYHREGAVVEPIDSEKKRVDDELSPL